MQQLRQKRFNSSVKKQNFLNPHPNKKKISLILLVSKLLVLKHQNLGLV